MLGDGMCTWVVHADHEGINSFTEVSLSSHVYCTDKHWQNSQLVSALIIVEKLLKLKLLKFVMSDENSIETASDAAGTSATPREELCSLVREIISEELSCAKDQPASSSEPTG